MTTYYVDFVNGLDANNGLGPDASHATNKPWKTVTKLLGAAGMASGDTAYLAPGAFREVVTIAMTSAVAETKILGDPWNAQGFKTSGGVRVAPGRVDLTAYTTNDKTTPSTTVLLNLSGRDNLTFRNIQFIGANNATASCLQATTTTSINITFEDCTFLPYFARSVLDATTVFATAFVWRMRRCKFGPCSSNNGLRWTAPTGVGSDYDVDVQITDCIFLACGTGSESVQLNTSGASAQHAGGLIMRNCFNLDSRLFRTIANTSTTIPCIINNCHIYAMNNTGITAGTASTVTEDRNLFICTTPTSGTVTAGGNSVTTIYAPLINFFNQEMQWGAPEPRPWAEPLKDGPSLIFGNDGSEASTDIAGIIRPSTAFCAVGPYGNRHNGGAKDPSPFGNGNFAMKIIGPGDYGARMPVTAGVNYDMTIDVKWDATYAGTKPKLVLDENPLVGVTAQTITATGSSGTPETLTLATFTPTRDGFIIFRVISSDTNGAGVMQADSLTVATS